MIDSHQMPSMGLVSAFQGRDDEEEKFFIPQAAKDNKGRIKSLS